jgi:integrase
LHGSKSANKTGKSANNLPTHHEQKNTVIKVRRRGKKLSPDELTRLLTAAPDNFKTILAIQAFAGLRSSEAMRFDWQNIELERGILQLTPQMPG